MIYKAPKSQKESGRMAEIMSDFNTTDTVVRYESGKYVVKAMSNGRFSQTWLYSAQKLDRKT